MSDTERIAVLETRADNQKEDTDHLFKFLRGHVEKEESEMRVIKKDISEINISISSFKGFVTGVVMSVSAFWAIIGIVIYIWGKL